MVQGDLSRSLFSKLRLSDMSGLDLMTAIRKKFSKAGIIIVDTAVPDDSRMNAFASAPALAQNTRSFPGKSSCGGNPSIVSAHLPGLKLPDDRDLRRKKTS